MGAEERQAKAHRDMQETVAKACAKSKHGLAIKSVKVVRLGEAVGIGESLTEGILGELTGSTSMRIDALQIFNAGGEIPLEWAIQAVPLDETRYVFLQQAAPKLFGANVDFDMYLARRNTFPSAVVAKNLGGACRTAFKHESYATGLLRQQFPEIEKRMVERKAGQQTEVARRLFEQAQFQRAISAANEVLAATPGEPYAARIKEDAQKILAEVDALTKQAKSPDVDQAAAAQERLLEIFKNNRVRAREIEAALRDLNARRASKLFKLANQLAAQGKNAEAREKLEALLQIKPNHQMAKELLAKVSG